MTVRGSNVDNVDIGVGNELGVGAICGSAAGTIDALDEVSGAVRRARGSDGDDLMDDAV